MKKPTERLKNVLSFVLTVAILGAFLTMVSLRAEAAPTYGYSTASMVGTQKSRAGDVSTDISCGMFAELLGKKAEMRIFADRVIASGMEFPAIKKEAMDTVALLRKLSMMQGVPIKVLLADIYPAMCSHIKA